jgi:hypothetical protein
MSCDLLWDAQAVKSISDLNLGSLPPVPERMASLRIWAFGFATLSFIRRESSWMLSRRIGDPQNYYNPSCLLALGPPHLIDSVGRAGRFERPTPCAQDSFRPIP